MRVTICIGSACHLKGSRQIIEIFERLIAENGLFGQVELNGSFCTGNCEHGVCVAVEDALYSVSPECAEEFFYHEIMGEGEEV